MDGGCEAGFERGSEHLGGEGRGGEAGAIPARVSVRVRPTATAGLANDVEYVNP
ncbi:hypothetical protein [Streptomyces sp. SID13726]|uniref:hypothetical protein n=1 Tax=Streptomyces sp. SID13726 TaxID=2706058 RepID=UPI0031BBA122